MNVRIWSLLLITVASVGLFTSDAMGLAEGYYVSSAGCRGDTEAEDQDLIMGNWGLANNRASGGGAINVSCPVIFRAEDTTSSPDHDIDSFRVQMLDQDATQDFSCYFQYRTATGTVYTGSTIENSTEGFSFALDSDPVINGGSAVIDVGHAVIRCSIPDRDSVSGNANWLAGAIVEEE